MRILLPGISIFFHLGTTRMWVGPLPFRPEIPLHYEYASPQHCEIHGVAKRALKHMHKPRIEPAIGP